METMLQAYRDRKEGKITVYTLVDDMVKAVQSGDIQALVYVVIDKDRNVMTAWSHNTITALGMLEVGKADIVNEMKK